MADALLSFRTSRHGPAFPALLAKYYAPAIVHGINQTIERIQDYTRQQMPTRFTQRTAASRRLLRNLVSIDRDEFASTRQNRFRGRVGIKASLGASEGVRRFAPRITRFVFGGTETARSGESPLYVPTRTLRSSPATTIRKDLYPRALGLLSSRRIEGGDSTRGLRQSRSGKVTIQGKRRTYAIDPRFHPNAPAGTHGVWQRRSSFAGVGADRRREVEIFKLWNYVGSIRIPRRIPWQEDSRRIYDETFVPRLRTYLETRAIRSLVRGTR